MANKQNVEKMLRRNLATRGYNLEVDNIVGKGVFAVVFAATKKKSRKNKQFAVKVSTPAIQFVEPSVKVKPKHASVCYKLEIKALRKIGSHHNVVSVKEWFVATSVIHNNNFTNYFLVMERADMDLDQLIRQSGHLSEEQGRLFARDMIAAVRFLHAKHIFHLDVKPGNFLLFENHCGIANEYTVKLCDFGRATKKTESSLASGTPPFMSPEVMYNCFMVENGQVVKRKAFQCSQTDLYSLGSTIFYILHGYYTVLNGQNDEQFMQFMQSIFLTDSKLEPDEGVYQHRFGQRIAPLRHDLSTECRELLSTLLHVDPSQRENFTFDWFGCNFNDNASEISSQEESKPKTCKCVIL